jgi:digeranylgeranylglycerophospholipid reductase
MALPSSCVSCKDSSVSVVGASVAGLVAAWRMACKGVRVRVYEAKEGSSFEPRTLIVTSAMEKLLDLDLRDCVLHKVNEFELISRCKSIRLPLRKPDLVVDRARLLSALARAATKAGVHLVLGHRLEDLECGPEECVLRFDTDRGIDYVESSWVVGADGAWSKIAERIGQPTLTKVALLQVRTRLPSGYPPGRVRVWFCRPYTRFFFWLIPESGDTGVFGLIHETMDQAKEALTRVMSQEGLEASGDCEEGWVTLPHLKPVPNGVSRNGRVILLGDAAGHVKSSTVGGVVTGIKGALAAVQTITEKESYTRKVLPLWQQLMLHRLLRKVLDGFTDEDYDKLISSMGEKQAAILATYSRDDLGEILWRLLFSKPQWYKLALEALVRKDGFNGSLERGTWVP